jgi:hypothetical protein
LGKRRRRRSFTFTSQFKVQVVLEVLTRLRSQAEAARQPKRIARWRVIALEHREARFRGAFQDAQG